MPLVSEWTAVPGFCSQRVAHLAGGRLQSAAVGQAFPGDAVLSGAV